MGLEADAQGTPLWRTMTASTISGVISRVVCHPLDTCKARLQASSPATTTTPYTNLLHVMRSTWIKEGLSGFYRGIGVSVVGSAPAACLFLTSYEEFKTLLQRTEYLAAHPILSHLSAGLLAEAFSCLLWVPIDVLKERLQIQHSYQGMNYRGSWHAMQTVLKYEGVSGIYKGYGTTLLSFGPYSAFLFAFYETFKAKAQQRMGPGELPFMTNMCAGALAAGLAAFITSPLDLVKLRLQIQRRKMSAAQIAPDYNYNYEGFLGAMRTMANAEGLRSFMKGAESRVLYSALMSACTLATFEWMKERLKDI